MSQGEIIARAIAYIYHFAMPPIEFYVFTQKLARTKENTGTARRREHGLMHTIKMKLQKREFVGDAVCRCIPHATMLKKRFIPNDVTSRKEEATG